MFTYQDVQVEVIEKHTYCTVNTNTIMIILRCNYSIRMHRFTHTYTHIHIYLITTTFWNSVHYVLFLRYKTKTMYLYAITKQKIKTSFVTSFDDIYVHISHHNNFVEEHCSLCIFLLIQNKTHVILPPVDTSPQPAVVRPAMNRLLTS